MQFSTCIMPVHMMQFLPFSFCRVPAVLWPCPEGPESSVIMPSQAHLPLHATWDMLIIAGPGGIPEGGDALHRCSEGNGWAAGHAGGRLSGPAGGASPSGAAPGRSFTELHGRLPSVRLKLKRRWRPGWLCIAGMDGRGIKGGKIIGWMAY